MGNSSKQRVVVLGGGFGGLESVFYLRKRLGKHANLTLVSDSGTFLYKPNTVYIPFGKDPERFVFQIGPTLDRREICFVQGRATRIDPKAKIVETTDVEVPYDYLIVATGAASRPTEIPGLVDYGHVVWTPGEMIKLRESLAHAMDSAATGKRQEVLFAIPMNNKCSAPLYELALMLDTSLRRKGARNAFSISFVTYETSLLQAFGPRLNDVIASEFKERKIVAHTDRRVSRVNKSTVRLDDGGELPFDLLVAFPPYIATMRYDALPSDDRGFLQTDLKTRQVQGQADVYAVGDAGDFPVKQAFLALLQADTAAEHISQRILAEEAHAKFDPVSMCILEQLDKATFAQVPLRLTGDPIRPVAVRENRPDLYKVSSGEIWRAGKKILSIVVPGRFRAGQPFLAGATWTVLEQSINMISNVFAE